jgi:hypothetical protein
MADVSKFEKMLELLVNEEKEAAQDLFHEIVVEKSREIYEGLLESEVEDEEVDEAADEDEDEEVEESKDEDEEEEMDEGFDLDEFEVEADPMDDMMSDIAPEGGDDMDMDMDMGDEEGEGDVEDRVEDLEAAFQDLKDEFEKMMADEDGDDEGDDMDMDMDMDGEDEEGEEDEAEKESFAFEAEEDEEDKKDMKKDPKSAGETMKEYVEKVTANMGDNGANTKSSVAGKNDMGGTVSNVAQNADGGNGGTQGGLANPTTKEEDAGNINVPGGKAAKATKPASKPKMGDTGTNGTRSVIGQ